MAPQTTKPQVEWLGQRYVLGRSQGLRGSSHDEYFLESEGPENWTQLLAVQKLEGRSPSSITENLKRSLLLQCEVLKETPNSTVLRLHEGNGEERREGILLIQATEDSEPGVVVITYLLKPARVEAELAKLQLEAWKERLLAQARSRTGKQQPRWTQNP